VNRPSKQAFRLSVPASIATADLTRRGGAWQKALVRGRSSHAQGQTSPNPSAASAIGSQCRLALQRARLLDSLSRYPGGHRVLPPSAGTLWGRQLLAQEGG
jgi:hypothetical protein